jgi:transcription initiation factor TFIIH subunit 1
VGTTDLQQTPETAAKVMLKIFARPSTGEGDPVAYLFHFLPADPKEPRREANAFKEVMSNLTTANNNSTPRPVAPNWFDDKTLQGDMELQQSLMKKDRILHQTYMDARATKPASISDAAFNSQFWSTRTNLLRAHAIETNQKKGTYNILAAIKPQTVKDELKLNITFEQVQMILQQHPLVQRIYNENVPNVLTEEKFWSRFFLSKLSKRLRGERANDNDNPDSVFDRYDAADDVNSFSTRITSLQAVPHTIDLQGNEENQGGFRSGNRQDQEMRPQANVPIVRTLNSISEKILANVAPTDHDPAATSGMDEETYRELHLRDLQGDNETARIILNVKEQNKFFSGQGSQDKSEDDKIFEAQNPSDAIFKVQADLEKLQADGAGGLDLHKGTGVDDESDSDGDDAGTANTNGAGTADHVGSRRARNKAQDQLFDGMRKKRAETYGLDSDTTSPMDINEELTQRCYITNATTTEFIRQFWDAFLSGNPDRAQELAYHVESLKRSMDRIEALAAEAEEGRAKVIEQKRQEIVDHYKRTNKKVKGWHPDLVRGGRKEVLALFTSTIDNLNHAQKLYQTALEAEGLRATTE